jgi:hypothetical protein
MTQAGFEPTITASGRKQTQGLERAATGIGDFYNIFLGASQYCEKRLVAASYLYVCAHGASRLTLEGFSLNFISEYFMKICLENPSFITI